MEPFRAVIDSRTASIAAAAAELSHARRLIEDAVFRPDSVICDRGDANENTSPQGPRAVLVYRVSLFHFPDKRTGASVFVLHTHTRRSHRQQTVGQSSARCLVS